MPALADTLRKDSPPGYEPVTAPARPPIAALPGLNNNFKNNPCIRTSLPPFNAGPDTLRQFNQDGMVPMRRVIPLPVSNGGGGGGVTNNNTTVISSGSGGGSSSTTLTPKTVTAKTSLLSPGAAMRQTIGMSSMSFQLLSCVATGPCEVRLYGTATAMAADASRVTDAPLAVEVANGLMSDIVLDTAPYTWAWQNRIGANQDSPQLNNLYISITNLSGATASPSVTITFLPLET